jgi:CBS domain-containing protein
MMDSFDGTTPGQDTVGGLMRRHFIALAPEDSLLDAFHLMRLARLRVLPVVRGEVLVGIVGFPDVAAGLLEELAGRSTAPGLAAVPVTRVLRPALETAVPRTTLAHAAESLVRLATGCLPVVDPDEPGPRLLGLVTETDLLRAALDGKDR